MRAKERLQKIENVAAGATASIALPIGNSYDEVEIQLAGVTKAQLTNWRLELDGDLVSDFKTTAQLEAFDLYESREVDNDTVLFQFDMSDITATIEQGRFFTLGTMGVVTANILVDIDAAASAPVLTGWAIKSKADRPGMLRKVRHYPFAVAAGENEITTIPKPSGASIKAIHLIKSDVTGAELVIDNVRWDNFSKASAERAQKRRGKTPQAGRYVLDFMLQGDIFECLNFPSVAAMQKGVPPVQDMRLRVNCATEGTLWVAVEYLDEYRRNGF